MRPLCIFHSGFAAQNNQGGIKMNLPPSSILVRKLDQPEDLCRGPWARVTIEQFWNLSKL
jgi:hypothetical protein